MTALRLIPHPRTRPNNIDTLLPAATPRTITCLRRVLPRLHVGGGGLGRVGGVHSLQIILARLILRVAILLTQFLLLV